MINMYFDIVVSLLSGRCLDLLTPGSNGAGADRHDVDDVRYWLP
jgi:hypothetical protein